jgi:DNA-binding response OmpR family regulator/Tfp pilus assembly protein PilF
MHDLLKDQTILIIDDFAAFRGTLKTMLHRLGAQRIDQAGNGSEAVKLCQQNDYDLIFCDYNLGEGQDGQQVLEELHQRSIIRRGALFLMVTAETTSAQVMGAIEYRPDSYLTKPFTGDQLGQRLKRLLHKNRSLSAINQAINAGDTEQALALCDRLVEQQPKLRLSALRIKSELLEQTGRLDQAEALYDEVLDGQQLLWAAVGKARLGFQRGDIEGALKQFIHIRDHYPKQVSVLDWIARCQQQLGKAEEAEQSLREALEISPKSLQRQARFAALAQQLGKAADAHKAWARTLQEGRFSCMVEPAHFAGYYQAASALAGDLNGREKRRLLSDGEGVFKELARKYRNNPTAQAESLADAAGFFSASGNQDRAIQAVGKLASALEDPACRLDAERAEALAGQLQQFEDDPALAKVLDKARSGLSAVQQRLQQEQADIESLSDRPASARSVNREGMALAKARDLSAALEKFRRAVRLCPDNPNYRLNAAQIILESPQLKTDPSSINEVRDYLARGFEGLAPDDPRWKRYQTLLGRLPRQH